MMAVASGRRGRPPKPRDAAGPTPERLGHGDVERTPFAIADEAGRPARPFRATDSLARMERNGTITPAMRQAADDFRALFQRASLDPLRAPDLRRPPGGGGAAPTLTERAAEARRRVGSALAAAGGVASPGGSCLWHIVGCEWSVRQWALSQGWGGRRLSEETAAGVLVAALGVLQALYGL